MSRFDRRSFMAATAATAATAAIGATLAWPLGEAGASLYRPPNPQGSLPA